MSLNLIIIKNCLKILIIGIVSYNIVKVTFSQSDIGIIFHTYYYYILKKKAVQVTIHGGYFSFKIARLVYLQRGRERAGRKKKVDAFQLTVEEKRGEPKFVNRGGVYTVGCIPIILGRRNSFLSAYGISCR